VHCEAAPVLYWPLLHTMQVTALMAEDVGEKVPASQATHEHAFVRLVLSDHVPAGHGNSTPCTQYDPCAHALQVP
jgi:hypothetical protein